MSCHQVQKDWTIEQVMEAHAKARAADPSKRDDPSMPLYQWVALDKLDHLEREFRAGDRFALLHAIRVCMNHDLVSPPWVVREYIAAFDSVLNYRKGSWDDAFGRPNPKGSHLAKAQKRHVLLFEVYNRIREIRLMEPGTPIDDGLFERVGAELGIGKTLANELYYKAKRIIDSMLPPDLQD